MNNLKNGLSIILYSEQKSCIQCINNLIFSLYDKSMTELIFIDNNLNSLDLIKDHYVGHENIITYKCDDNVDTTKCKFWNWCVKKCTKKNIMIWNIDNILITSKFEELMFKHNIKHRNDNFMVKYKIKSYYNNKHISDEITSEGVIFSHDENFSFGNDLDSFVNTSDFDCFNKNNNYLTCTFDKVICYKNSSADVLTEKLREEKITNIFCNVQNKFIVIIPSFNNDIEITKKCLNSVINQNYKNYRVCFTDDNSDNKQFVELAKEICNNNNFSFVQNSTNHGALYNIVHGINKLSPKDDEIITTLDGDDWLENNYVLDILNANYQDNTQLTYGRFMYSNKNKGDMDALGFSEEINEQYLKVGFRKIGWVFSHLRTFKYRLWKNIKDTDLKDENNEYYRVTWDMAFMMPMIEMSYPYVNLVDIPLYVYNVDNELNDSKLRENEQIKYEKIIRSKIPYCSLYNFI